MKKRYEEFVTLFRQQVFVSKTNTTTVAECIRLAKEACDTLTTIGTDEYYYSHKNMYITGLNINNVFPGLEMTFVLERSLMADMEKIVREGIAFQLEAVKHRAQVNRI